MLGCGLPRLSGAEGTLPIGRRAGESILEFPLVSSSSTCVTSLARYKFEDVSSLTDPIDASRLVWFTVESIEEFASKIPFGCRVKLVESSSFSNGSGAVEDRVARLPKD